jgi:hypothetical protein
MNVYYRERERKNAEMWPYQQAVVLLLLGLLLLAWALDPVTRFLGEALDREAAYQQQRLDRHISPQQRRELAGR